MATDKLVKEKVKDSSVASNVIFVVLIIVSLLAGIMTHFWVGLVIFFGGCLLESLIRFYNNYYSPKQEAERYRNSPEAKRHRAEYEARRKEAEAERQERLKIEVAERWIKENPIKTKMIQAVGAGMGGAEVALIGTGYVVGKTAQVATVATVGVCATVIGGILGSFE